MASKTKRCLPQAAFALFFTLSALCGCASVGGRDGAGDARLSTGASKTEAGGVRVERITIAAAGYMLDMRYRIIDAELAGRTLQRDTGLMLVDQATGTKLEVPNMAKVGKLRQLPGKDGDRIYWMFFNNPGGLVKAGAKVTLKLGDLKIEDIVVQ